jgi:leucyl/phenylalanyl-tRNA---protein transferase
MPVFSLTRDYKDVPDARYATRSGLIAVSMDIHPERILAGYRAGMFPWFQHYDGLFHWYAPNPRSVVYPKNIKVHKSMRSIFNQNKFEYSFDRAFAQVIENCRSTRRDNENGEASSWLNSNFLRSYHALHEQGLCHSVEVWQDGKLVGGLYGVSFGRIFFGESMFSHVPNASKAGFITLVRALHKAGFLLVDCQQDSQHLRSLGSSAITIDTYLEHLKENAFFPSNAGLWSYDAGTESLIVSPLGESEV